MDTPISHEYHYEHSCICSFAEKLSSLKQSKGIHSNKGSHAHSTSTSSSHTHPQPWLPQQQALPPPVPPHQNTSTARHSSSGSDFAPPNQEDTPPPPPPHGRRRNNSNREEQLPQNLNHRPSSLNTASAHFPPSSPSLQQNQLHQQYTMNLSQSLNPLQVPATPTQEAGQSHSLMRAQRRSLGGGGGRGYVPTPGNFSSLPRTHSQSSSTLDTASRNTKPYSSARSVR